MNAQREISVGSRDFMSMNAKCHQACSLVHRDPSVETIPFAMFSKERRTLSEVDVKY